MSEYIFWDKFREKFSEDLIVSGITVNEIFEECEDWKAFIYIGLNDISDNKIYADSSIVEFEYYIKEQFFKGIGYITYIKNLCCYCICTFNKLSTTIAETEFLNFKIIDTIQENKLGLIKA